MNAVLYTESLTPISVVNLPQRVWETLARGDVLQFPLPEASPHFYTGMVPITDSKVELVGLRADVIQRGQYRSLLVFTTEMRHSLLLLRAVTNGLSDDLSRDEARLFAARFARGLKRITG